MSADYDDYWWDQRIAAYEEWPLFAYSDAEQPPFRSHLAAARWAEDHDEDLNRYDSEDET